MAKIAAAFYNGLFDKNNYNIMPAWYESLFEGLRKAGNELLLFPLKEFRKEYGEISIAVKERILAFNPDLCISFNNVFYDFSFLDCPILICDVDSPLYWENKNRLIENKDRYLYAMMGENQIELLQSTMGIKKKIYKLRPFTSVSRDDKAIQSFNISFIGTRFGVDRKNEIGSLENEPQIIRDEYARCLKYICENPFAAKEDVILHNSVQSDYIKHNLDIPGIVMMLSSEKRVRVLSSIVDLGLQLYGTRTWMSKYHFDSRINVAFVDKKVYSLRDNQDIYNRSKIGINISHLQAKGTFPWRVLDIMASNACLVNDGWSEVKEFFKDLPIPIYYDEHEARSICKRLLSDDSQRESIVRLCNEYVDKNYRFNMLLEELMSFTEVKLDNYDRKGTIKIVDYSTIY